LDEKISEIISFIENNEEAEKETYEEKEEELKSLANPIISKTLSTRRSRCWNERL